MEKGEAQDAMPGQKYFSTSLGLGPAQYSVPLVTDNEPKVLSNLNQKRGQLEVEGASSLQKEGMAGAVLRSRVTATPGHC